MEALGPAKAAPSTEELIAACGQAINDVMRQEMSDESDPDRVWILRWVHKNYLYYRNLQYYAPQIYQGLLDLTSVGGQSGNMEEIGNAVYDYSQNHYKGYCRKLEAVLGNRMPNVTAQPDNHDDEQSARATRSANNAALYVRHKCQMQMKSIYLTFGLFNFGTMFWHLDWEVDGDKYGFKSVPQTSAQDGQLGNAAFNCPNCGTSTSADPNNPQPPAACEGCGQPMSQANYQPPTPVQVPQTTMQQVPKGALRITLHDASEISVPLDATSIDDCDWLRWERETSKAKALRKWKDKARDSSMSDASGAEETVSQQYAEAIRSARGSPIGLVRARRPNRWTESDTWWTPAEYELVEDKAVRQMLYENFPRGLRISAVRGKIVDLKEEKLSDRWQECLPEPSARIMADPLGNDWTEYQDIADATMNQCYEIIERSNDPGFGDPTKIDFDAWQNRKDMPGELFPAVRPAGGKLSDIIYRPPPVQFSEQIPPFVALLESRVKNNSGLLDPIWGGGDAEEPTARQAELKKNAALMQLGVPWAFMGRSLEKVYHKACMLLSEYEDGVLEFSQKNQFGRYNKMAIVVDDLRNGGYHFEADEAIPMTWGQMRDLLMWMLDKPAPLLEMWGMNDPLNIFEFKNLLGMPGMRTPLLDDRDKAMDVIAQLIEQTPQPGPPNPDGSPGAPGPSIQPDWEDNHDFCARLVKAYLQVNASLKTDKPDGYQNVVLWGQAHEKMATPPPQPPKGSVTLALKGPDLGDPAVQAALTQSNIVPQGTPVQSFEEKQQAFRVSMGLEPPPPGTAPMPPPGPPNGVPAPPVNGAPQQ